MPVFDLRVKTVLTLILHKQFCYFLRKQCFITCKFLTAYFFKLIDVYKRQIGTLIGVSDKAGMLDEDGKLPNVKQALMADAIATSAGAVLGTCLLYTSRCV